VVRVLLAVLGWRWYRKTTRPKPVPQEAAQINNATVTVLLGAVRDMLKDESARAASLNGRAAGLTGFVGIILSIAAATGAAVGKGATTGLHHGVRVLVGVLVGLALLALVSAVVAVVSKVLLPSDGYAITVSEVKTFPTWEFIRQEPVMVEGYLLKGAITSLVRDRDRHAGKAKWLGRSYKMVCLGLILVAIAGTAATLDRYVAGGPDRARQPKPQRAGPAAGSHAPRQLRKPVPAT
jgi:uncharacterized membrane protein